MGISRLKSESKKKMKPSPGHGMGNRIYPYKRRKLDLKKEVSVYRCLGKGSDKMYSVKQDGRVVAHTDCLMLGNVEFVVSESGRKKVLKTGHKNVHAFMNGKIALKGGMGTTAERCEEKNDPLPAIMTYDPRKDCGFVCRNLTVKPFIVKGAMVAVVNKNGLSASCTH